MGWEADLAAVDDAAASYFDTELFSVVPMRRSGGVNSVMTLDAGRQEFTFNGSIDFNPPAVQAGFLQQSASGNRDTVMHEAVVTASMGNWPWMPRVDDRIVHHAKSLTYQVASRPRDDSGRAVIFVSRVKS